MWIIKISLISILLSSYSLCSNVENIKNSMEVHSLELIANNKINRMENESIIKSNYKYYDNVLRNSKKYYMKIVSEKWGKKNIKFSSNKNFTQYSKDLDSRENIDFEKGLITIEVLSNIDKKIEPKIFTQKLKNLKKQSVSDGMKKDPILNLSNEYLKSKKLLNQDFDKKEVLIKGLVEKESIDKSDIKEKVLKEKKKKITYIKIKMIPNHLEKRALKYKDKVVYYAKKFDVKSSHIFGTIQAESYFNPLAISYIPAYGLMQIVPSSGGKDAYYRLTGNKKVLSSNYLYNVDNNIKIGTKYIQVIKESYLKGIKDKKSLFYCSATAYNAGIGTLIKSFTGSYSKRKKAIEIINSMSSDDVYNHLRKSNKLTKEAKGYVKKIRDYSTNYYKWDI